MTIETDSLRAPVGMVAATASGMAAAILYTCSNIALRQSVGLDPFLVAAMKALPTIVVLGPFVLFMRMTGQTIATSLRMLPRFAAAALVTQVIGNGAFQFALGSIGLAATVPITLGVLIIGGAVFGRILLGEPVRMRTIVAMVVLIIAVIVLSLPDATEAPAQSAEALPVWGGVLCAAGSGLSYAFFGVVLRQTLNGGISAPATMLVSGVVGAISLWSTTFLRIEFASLGDITSNQWVFLVLGGVFNFSAFVALSVALKALPVVAVNLINASQVAMAATAGVILFSEPVTLPLLVGIALTFAGLMVLASGRRGKNGASETP
ncbi:DMT family transporter [Novipirellula artificiosorum]|uniref:EamA-like transporter family protein n=1 Tax=Novipirellula artificiosorum TaxID=2528016 RepID=A0A5C6DZD3_9BACT|nr:DMT family transporter [Novipirellula artificiosorum]TWU40811.1 EamA-like transporter family protein [Novipirellula artificiosorum]